MSKMASTIDHMGPEGWMRLIQEASRSRQHWWLKASASPLDWLASPEHQQKCLTAGINKGHVGLTGFQSMTIAATFHMTETGSSQC